MLTSAFLDFLFIKSQEMRLFWRDSCFNIWYWWIFIPARQLFCLLSDSLSFSHPVPHRRCQAWRPLNVFIILFIFPRCSSRGRVIYVEPWMGLWGKHQLSPPDSQSDIDIQAINLSVLIKFDFEQVRVWECFLISSHKKLVIPGSLKLEAVQCKQDQGEKWTLRCQSWTHSWLI